MVSRRRTEGSKSKGSSTSVRILIVEDEEKMAKALRTGLEADEFSVSVAHTGEDGFFLASTEPFDLVILDLMLPRRDGMEVLAALRQKNISVPVLILTSKDTVKDRVRGLDAGADDYLVKPFAFSELLARIRALLRRGKSESGDKLRFADLELDAAGRTASRNGKELTLTAREFDLLEYLLRRQGTVVSREMLARDVWQETERYTPLDNVIDVHVAHLRKKLDEPFKNETSAYRARRRVRAARGNSVTALVPKRVRTRLTLWHVVMLAGVLAVYLAGVSVLLFWQAGDILKRIAAEDLETLKGLLYVADDGQVGVREDYHHHTDWKQVQERLLEILGPDGSILYRNERLGDRSLGGPPFAGEGEKGYSGRTARMSDGTPVILISRKYDLQGRTILIRVGYGQDLIWNQLKQTLLVLLLASPLVLAGAAWAGYKIVGRALDPVSKMAHRAEQINSERLNERLPVENPHDELGHLAGVFNAMLSRIEQSFEQLQRFTSDASHELRTPLAAIRSIGEVRLQEERHARRISRHDREHARRSQPAHQHRRKPADAFARRRGPDPDSGIGFPARRARARGGRAPGSPDRRQAAHFHAGGRRKSGRAGRSPLRPASDRQYPAQCREVHARGRLDFCARRMPRRFTCVELVRHGHGSRDSGGACCESLRALLPRRRIPNRSR